ncbi:MAG TPA: hypothetical protein DDZ51_23025 [Planctomycetaceae bacterium]|nr:hypothetical protein [Planctomycetaceae bacterium]
MGLRFVQDVSILLQAFSILFFMIRSDCSESVRFSSLDSESIASFAGKSSRKIITRKASESESFIDIVKTDNPNPTSEPRKKVSMEIIFSSTDAGGGI